MTDINWDPASDGTYNTTVPDEVVDKAAEKPRVLTYTRTYRIETSLTDVEIIAYANEANVRDIDSLVDALDLMADFHDSYGADPDDKVVVEVHSSQVDERDPGLF